MQKKKKLLFWLYIKLLQIVSDGDLRRNIHLFQSISQLDSYLMSYDIIMDICGIIPNNIMENLFSDWKGKKNEGVVDSMKSFITSG